MQALSCAPEVQLFRYRDEVPQLAQLSRNIRFRIPEPAPPQRQRQPLTSNSRTSGQATVEKRQSHHCTDGPGPASRPMTSPVICPSTIVKYHFRSAFYRRGSPQSSDQ